MNLDEIPGGSLCVIDTNVLIYAEQGISAQAQRLLARCAKGELSITLPQTVWHEFTHKLMLAEAMMRGTVTGSRLAAKLAAKPDVVRKLSIYQSKVRALVDLGVGFEPCTRADLTESVFSLQGRYGLLTNDAMVLAVALRLKADALVSSDKAFLPVAEIAVHAPSDIRLGALQ
jgi:predicted nucleic acid-binding protein